MYRNMCIDVLGISVYGVRPVDKKILLHMSEKMYQKNL